MIARGAYFLRTSSSLLRSRMSPISSGPHFTNSASPFDRLSYTTGVKPLLNRSRHVCAPMYPAPPATRIFVIIEFPRTGRDIAGSVAIDNFPLRGRTLGRALLARDPGAGALSNGG